MKRLGSGNFVLFLEILDKKKLGTITNSRPWAKRISDIRTTKRATGGLGKRGGKSGRTT